MASRMASLALRAGLRPARVRIAVDGTTEDYWALEIEHAYGDDVTGGVGDAPILTLPIVTRTMVAWRGGPVERVISITVSSDTGIFSLARLTSEVPPPYPLYIGPAFGIMFERRGPVHFAIDGGARSTRQEIGEACAVPERPSFMQILSPVAAPTSCHRARFFTRFSMQLQDGFGDELGGVRVRTVAMDGHDIPGIRLEYALRWEPCPVCR